TKIDQFKFELDDRLLKFDFDEFYINIEKLYTLHKIGKYSDSEIIQVAKDLKLYKVLFVIDEIHNYFRVKEDPVLVWWLTYHRHLSHDLYLITQDLSLVNSEYKRIAEKFYKAIDSSKRLFSKTFKYAYFSSYKMNACDRVNSFNINLPFNPEVYKLYHSGANSKSKSILKFYVIVGVLLVLFTISLFLYALNSFSVDSDSNSLNSVNNQSLSYELSNSRKSPDTSPTPKSLRSSDIDEIYVYNIVCINDQCHFSDDDNLFPYGFISHTISGNRPAYFYSNSKNKHFIEYFIVFDNPVLESFKQKIINKGVPDEKNSPSLTPVNLF
ncbi:MAG: zonular occludens toxin domain-containing protein, partial [Campylobacter sp.]|nr:zonular occludens toxin domain-containing protein [Campylobacter sp.]